MLQNLGHRYFNAGSSALVAVARRSTGPSNSIAASFLPYRPRPLFIEARSPANSFSTSSIASKPLEKPADSGACETQSEILKHEWCRHALSELRESIHDRKNKKWGYLIYRCDYGSNDDWAKFLTILHWNVKHSLDLYGGADLLPSLDMTVHDDRAALEGATINQVRELFTAWVRSDEARDELGETPFPAALQFPRHTYCIYVDADAIDSVVNRAPQPPQRDFRKIGYVTLIKIYTKGFTENRTYKHDLDEHNPDEGDPNCVRIPISCVDPETYGSLFDQFSFGLMARWRRPEDGVTLGCS